MVKLCETKYPIQKEEQFGEFFSFFGFPLSDFQKHAIEAIVTGNHTLICSGTGNGKTLPSEFAIQYFVGMGKKVIYTSPIKALSNQKYYDFKIKYPNISFGLLTGDIKINPEADVLIMTAEILQNTLFRRKEKEITTSLLSFDMDFDNELACVVHDEVHSINMPDRGCVWENIFMLLPGSVQNVMLSATLDSPERFAIWCETVSNQNLKTNEQQKIVYLTTLKERVVPLTHYSYITSTEYAFKVIKDKKIQQEIRDVINKPIIIQNEKNVFDDMCYHKMTKTLKMLKQHNVHIKRQFVLNQVCKYMVENSLLPCACFILSRKQLEMAAREVTVPLLEDDSKIPYTIRRECEQIMRSKLGNYEEYLNLPEYLSMVALLEKGIATHHSGTLPILKEIVELLFSKGYIKLLFATETFSCGLNMPIKTVIFTDVSKFDGHQFRVLHGYEYIQAGGRAGRRGLDKVGHVIHLNNLFKHIELTDYKNMMQGKSQKLTSKFKISYNLVLNLLKNNNTDYISFIKRSMVQQELDSEVGSLYSEMTLLEKEVEDKSYKLVHLGTSVEVLDRYREIQRTKHHMANKKRKDADRELSKLSDENRNIIQDLKTYELYSEKVEELRRKKLDLDATDNYLEINVNKVITFLSHLQFINEDKTLTSRGLNACELREVHCLCFADLIDKGIIDRLTPTELIELFGCFTNVAVEEDLLSIVAPQDCPSEVRNALKDISRLFTQYNDFETHNYLDTGSNYTLHYDLLNYMSLWINCSSDAECKVMLKKLEDEKGIFLGEFVKAVLKVVNISSEMERIAERCGNMDLLSKLKEIPSLVMKYVATNQSLYI
jgi:superfamily II RNA helicase